MTLFILFQVNVGIRQLQIHLSMAKFGIIEPSNQIKINKTSNFRQLLRCFTGPNIKKS